MGWQSYRHVVHATTPQEAFELAKDQVDWIHLRSGEPSGTILEQTDFQVVTLPTLDELTEEERASIAVGEVHARTSAFERRLAAADRSRQYVRTNYRSWIADLGDGTMVAFGWAYAG